MSHIKWWQWLPFFPWRIVASVEAAPDIPDRLPRNGVVLVGTRAKPKWLAFDCPCRGGHRITIPLDPNTRPHWTVTDHEKLSVHPSVDFQAPGLRCHYFIRRARIQWARDSVRRR